MKGHSQYFGISFHDSKILQLGLSLLIGVLFGGLVIVYPDLPLPSDFQKLILVLPFAFLLVALFNNLEKLILFAIAIAIPLNLDFSVIISPYSRNAVNVANGHRTIVALTELRVSLILILVVIGYVLWFVERRGASSQRMRFFPSISIPALGLIFVATLSLFRAQDTQLSLFRILQLIELFLAYLYLANHIRTRQNLKFFVIVLMGMMLVESILMIVQWRTGWGFSIAGISTDRYGGRATGTLGSAPVAAAILSAQLSIACAMIWLFSIGSRKIFAMTCFVIGCVALISTGGRAAWGSFIVVMFGFIIIGYRRGWIHGKSVVMLFLLTLIIGGIFFPAISNRLTSEDHGSAASRLKMFRLAWNVIWSSPAHLLFGVGANNYALIAPVYNTADVGYLGFVIDSSVHNAYLLAWAETGLLGLFFFIGFLITPLVKAWKYIHSNDRFNSLMALGLGCALTAMCIQMLVDPFVVRPLNIILWLLISLIASLDNIRSNEVDPLVTREI